MPDKNNDPDKIDYFITNDARMRSSERRRNVLADADREAMPPGVTIVTLKEFLEIMDSDDVKPPKPVPAPPGTKQLTPELLRDLKPGVAEADYAFREVALLIMTDRRAKRVRQLRVACGCSWRKVAEVCHKHFKGAWDPPDNQIMGMALCEEAARRLGENAYDDDWN